MEHKARLIDDGVWSRMDIYEKKEINDELEKKLRDKEERDINVNNTLFSKIHSKRKHGHK